MLIKKKSIPSSFKICWNSPAFQSWVEHSEAVTHNSVFVMLAWKEERTVILCRNEAPSRTKFKSPCSVTENNHQAIKTCTKSGSNFQMPTLVCKRNFSVIVIPRKPLGLIFLIMKYKKKTILASF